MKKQGVALLSTVLALTTLTACSGQDSPDAQPPANDTTAVEAEEEAQEDAEEMPESGELYDGTPDIATIQTITVADKTLSVQSTAGELFDEAGLLLDPSWESETPEVRLAETVPASDEETLNILVPGADGMFGWIRVVNETDSDMPVSDLPIEELYLTFETETMLETFGKDSSRLEGLMNEGGVYFAMPDEEFVKVVGDPAKLNAAPDEKSLTYSYHYTTVDADSLNSVEFSTDETEQGHYLSGINLVRYP